MLSSFPSYLNLHQNGELKRRAAKAKGILAACSLCPRQCLSDRLSGKTGVCRIGEYARVASYGAHLGEEDPLRGWRGSGTIFFSGCNLCCQYCQNFDISQSPVGEELDAVGLAGIMLELQEAGCHNINFVSPTHVVPQILEGVLVAAQAGLSLPLVYNTGGYDALETLKLLDGVIDIYMPDMKYASIQAGLHYSKIRDYPYYNQAAVREMHRQVGDLELDAHGLARRGLLVRHLVLPNDIAGTPEIVRFLAEEISPNTYLNLMDQYRPAYNASLHPRINRPLRSNEYRSALDMAGVAGLQRLDERRPLW